MAPRRRGVSPYPEAMGPWTKLALAIVVEVAATLALRQSDGMTQPVWTAAMVIGYLVSFWLLAQITGDLEIGVIYAVWSAAGTALVAAIGIALFGEQLSALKLVGIALIIAGVVALNLGGGGGHGEAASRSAPPTPTA